MHTFRLWAPKAKRVRVKVAEGFYALAPGAGGWWWAAVEPSQPGSDYSYFLGAQERPLPDPRSLWQPYGVHGASRVLDHAEFSWSDGAWQAPPLPGSVLYELHIGTFTLEGTFDAARQKLSHLRELGITHVELMPVASFPGKQGWGYDGVDLFAPQEAYGGPAGLKRFVDACHAHGLAVILDVVYNHLGPSGNYLGLFGPYFTNAHYTPWGDAVNLEDAGSHEVRRFFCDNALMWLRDYHFDGLRLDAVHAYMDRSAIHFTEQLASEVRELQAKLGKHFIVIAESDLNDPRLVQAREAHGYGLDAQWSDDFHHALVTVLTGERGGYYVDFGRLADLAKALQQVFVYDGRYSIYRDRVHGRSAMGVPGWRFLGYSQNHDQVGNRVKGERLVQVAGLARAKIAAALELTAPFTPLIFQGEEWAASTPFQYFTDHEDLELGRLISEGRRREFAAFGWDLGEVPDPQDAATFERSKLDWGELGKEPHAAVLDWYKRLIQLRKSSPDLLHGDMGSVEVQSSEEQQWLTMTRGNLLVAFTLAASGAELAVAGGAQLVMASDPAVAVANGRLRLAADSVAILRLTEFAPVGGQLP
jgi:maltooligosyltrehalose trehalohydrolase